MDILGFFSWATDIHHFKIGLYKISICRQWSVINLWSERLKYLVKHL